jgi:hypothetical protein
VPCKQDSAVAMLMSVDTTSLCPFLDDYYISCDTLTSDRCKHSAGSVSRVEPAVNTQVWRTYRWAGYKTSRWEATVTIQLIAFISNADRVKTAANWQLIIVTTAKAIPKE